LWVNITNISSELDKQFVLEIIERLARFNLLSFALLINSIPKEASVSSLKQSSAAFSF
jgi:hypothetical protein